VDSDSVSVVRARMHAGMSPYPCAMRARPASSGRRTASLAHEYVGRFHRRNSRVGREEEGMSSVRVELGEYLEILERTPKGAGMPASRASCAGPSGSS
jgi:hypothetical protein